MESGELRPIPAELFSPLMAAFSDSHVFAGGTNQKPKYQMHTLYKHFEHLRVHRDRN